MGEVYQAEDTRLHRLVAVKILSERLEVNPQTIERFEREARAAASLNHPNICTIYDVGTDPPFIAMELLEGQTLQQRLSRGALDVTAAVDITIGLVDALEVAHSKGLLHRDIKPANIFLTERGPKILDFGVAKVLPTAPISATPGETQQTTETLAPILTGAGTAIGTVAYMSPEQLRGLPLDARSDLFSVGLIMYEMVTGRSAFSGGTSAVVAAAILHEQPEPPRHIREDVPARLEEVILKTLEKDPRDRTQTAADLRAELRRLKREFESGSPGRGASTEWKSPGEGRPSSGARPRRGDAKVIRRDRRPVLVGAALAVAMAGLMLVLWPRISAVRNTTSNTLLQDLQVSQVTVTGNAWRPALSPDGKFVVYIRRDSVEGSLRMRQLGTDRDVEIAGRQPGLVLQAATVTPDGQFVDFVRGTTEAMTLWRVPFLGGSPKRLIDDVGSPVGWSPDGQHLAFVRAVMGGRSTLVVAGADGGNERTLAARTLPGQFLSFTSRATPSGQGASISPAWSPDGKTLALIGAASVGGVVTRQVVFVNVASGVERSIPIRDEGSADGIAWLNSGQLIVSHNGRNDSVSQLRLVSHPSGTWSRLTNDLSNYASFSVSADRRSIAVARWDLRIGISVLEAASAEPSDIVPAGPFVGEDLAWAGNTLLYAVLSPADNRPAIWALHRGESAAEELIGNAYSPAATPDGQTILFSRVENGRRGIWRADRDGRGAVEVGVSAASRVNVTRDGKQVVFLSLERGAQAVWTVPLDGGTPMQVTNMYAFQPVPSPDGRSVAFVSLNEQKRSVIAICALPNCSSKRTLPIPRRPAALQWTPNGRGLAYATLSNIWVQPLDNGPPYQLTHFPEDDRRIEDFEWSPDGKRLAFSRSRRTWDIVLFRGAR